MTFTESLKRKKHKHIRSGFRQALWCGRLAFFISGALTGPWACIMPGVKSRLNLSGLEYSHLILMFGIGSLLTMPLTANLARRFGVKPLITLSALGMIIAILGLSAPFTSLTMAFILVMLWGGSLGILDVADNIHGTHLERITNKRLMSGCHAQYNLGCIAATIVFTILMSAGAAIWAAALGLCIVILRMLYTAQHGVINVHGNDQNYQASSSKNSIRRKSKLPFLMLLMIGTSAFIAFFNEGMIYDWSGIFLIEVNHISFAHAAAGYLAFESAVATMRLFGDRITTRWGIRLPLISSGICAIIAMFLITQFHLLWVSIAGMAVMGLSLANVVPIMFSEAARRCPHNPGRAISIVGTMGYAGTLIGPAILGIAVMHSGLNGIFYFSILLTFIMEIMIILILRKSPSNDDAAHKKMQNSRPEQR